MPESISQNVWTRLACSFCGNALVQSATGASCPVCGLQYRRTGAAALDLRLNKAKTYELQFELGTPFNVPPGLRIAPLALNPRAQVDFSGLRGSHRMTPEKMSYFPKASSRGALMLDLACGSGIHKPICEHAGFEWVGIDYAESSKATILADVHALPFKDASFDCILTVAAIQLFRYPLVAMREVCRVLKPGGTFLGTVAFLEPFHDDGYYHYTHLGVINSLQYGGFKVEQLAPSEDWTGLTAQAAMALFPRMPRFMSRSIVYPVQLLHRAWWYMGSLVAHTPNAGDDVRIRNSTAAFAFVASKPAA